MCANPSVDPITVVQAESYQLACLNEGGGEAMDDFNSANTIALTYTLHQEPTHLAPTYTPYTPVGPNDHLAINQSVFRTVCPPVLTCSTPTPTRHKIAKRQKAEAKDPNPNLERTKRSVHTLSKRKKSKHRRTNTKTYSNTTGDIHTTYVSMKGGRIEPDRHGKQDMQGEVRHERGANERTNQQRPSRIHNSTTGTADQLCRTLKRWTLRKPASEKMTEKSR
ncbi:hypothetical protein EDC04DRAFT_234871 [Pisolithus marmoratus]|nr:hypothetical protein EDC04DRAFT_234871 [Pisolithus marmoratus]